MNTLCSVQLTPSIKLQSIAAAVQVWPEALLPPASSTSHSCQDLLQHFGLLGICVHARLQHLCQQHGAKSSTDEQMKQKTAAEVFPSPGKRLGEAGRQLMLRWDRNRMTQIAAQTLHSLLHCSWGQQAEQQDRSAAQLSTEAVKQLPAIAAEQVLAELRELGTTEDADDELVDDRWADLGLALQLMISILGWEWAYEHVSGAVAQAIIKQAYMPCCH